MLSLGLGGAYSQELQTVDGSTPGMDAWKWNSAALQQTHNRINRLRKMKEELRASALFSR